MYHIHPVCFGVLYTTFFLTFFDRASRYTSICVTKTNLMHYLSSVYFVIQPLHVSGIFVAHHQAVYCIYTTCCAFSLLSVGRPTDSQL